MGTIGYVYRVRNPTFHDSNVANRVCLVCCGYLAERSRCHCAWRSILDLGLWLDDSEVVPTYIMA